MRVCVGLGTACVVCISNCFYIIFYGDGEREWGCLAVVIAFLFFLTRIKLACSGVVIGDSDMA